MQKITPFLWFNGRLEEALEFYTSIFSNARILNVHRMGDKVFTASFELEGQQFMMLDGGPQYPFNPAVSFFVTVETQEELDHYWYKLISDTGREDRCGWLVDKFGISWQIIPSMLGSVLWGGSDPEASQRAMQAMLQMRKLDIQGLRDAFEGIRN